MYPLSCVESTDRYSFHEIKCFMVKNTNINTNICLNSAITHEDLYYSLNLLNNAFGSCTKTKTNTHSP